MVPSPHLKRKITKAEKRKLAEEFFDYLIAIAIAVAVVIALVVLSATYE